MKKYTGFTICLTFNIWKPFLFVMFVLFFKNKRYNFGHIKLD